MSRSLGGVPVALRPLAFAVVGSRQRHCSDLPSANESVPPFPCRLAGQFGQLVAPTVKTPKSPSSILVEPPYGSFGSDCSSRKNSASDGPGERTRLNLRFSLIPGWQREPRSGVWAPIIQLSE